MRRGVRAVIDERGARCGRKHARRRERVDVDDVELAELCAKRISIVCAEASVQRPFGGLLHNRLVRIGDVGGLEGSDDCRVRRRADLDEQHQAANGDDAREAHL